MKRLFNYTKTYYPWFTSYPYNGHHSVKRKNNGVIAVTDDFRDTGVDPVVNEFVEVTRE